MEKSLKFIYNLRPIIKNTSNTADKTHTKKGIGFHSGNS